MTLSLTGTGRQVGPLRPDWGDGWADLECHECRASWTGLIGEQCPWCDEALERMRRWQAEMTLGPPEIDPDDRTYDDVMRGWGERLANAVRAGIVGEAEARRAWEKATK